MNGITTDEDGNLYDNISSYFYKFDSLTEDDVKLPDLTGYVIKDSNGHVINQ